MHLQAGWHEETAQDMRNIVKHCLPWNIYGGLSDCKDQLASACIVESVVGGAGSNFSKRETAHVDLVIGGTW